MIPGDTSRVRPSRYARIAGALYMIVILGGTFAEVLVRSRLVVPGNVAATAHNLLLHALLYRSGLAVEVFYCACNVPLILLLYHLLKVVNKNVAVMMAVFALIADAVESASLLSAIAPLAMSQDAHALSGFTAEQLNAAAYLSAQLFEQGFAVSLVFFGFSCLTMAYLIVHSKFLPRIIGILLAIEGMGYLTNSFTLLLAPALEARIFPYFTATAIAEISFSLWLLVMGVDDQRWQRQADAGIVCAQVNVQ